MIDEKVNDAIIQHQKKVLWQKEQESLNPTDNIVISQKAQSMVLPSLKPSSAS